jgi:hypothetical protein
LEFQTVDSVPAALAKDRRKIGDQEISVTMLWRSTLFITNFAPQTDDKQIRQLFGNVSSYAQRAILINSTGQSLTPAGQASSTLATADSVTSLWTAL